MKTEVYSWRVSPALKGRLEDLAQRERRSVAALLEELVYRQLELRERDALGDDERQRQLHAAAAEYAGSLAGANPQRSTTVRETVRARLRSRTHGGR